MPIIEADRAVAGLIRELETVAGKKALQKLVYLLQHGEGYDLGLSFRMYQYGPYCADLDWIIKDLEMENLVEIFPGETYRIKSKKSDADSQPGPIINVAEKFGDLKAWELELLASLHFLSTRKPYRGTDSDKALLKRKLHAWKGTKFTEQEINWAINRLESADYFPKSQAPSDTLSHG